MSLQVGVDVETSYEFIKEIYTHIEPGFLQGLSKLLEEKSEFFSSILKKESFGDVRQDDFFEICKRIFALKKFAKKWTSEQFDQMKDYVFTLLYGDEPLTDRFTTFCEKIATNFKITRPYEVASELLTYTNPNDYFLWANWIYNPDTENGSIMLVFEEEFKLRAPILGDLYIQIIEAQRELLDKAIELGISPSPDPQGNSVFDVPVFLCAVYAVYTFTVTKLRISSEFNTILPNLDELLARLLGVYRV